MPRLDISFLGPFQVALDSTPVKGFESDKVRALLAYLVVEAGQPHRRDSLAALLWPEQRQEAALKNLRHVLYKLRQVLGDSDQEGSSDQASYLEVSTQSVEFTGAGNVRLDVTEFANLIAACQSHKHRRLEVCGSCHARLRQAMELYRGDFLSGFALDDSTEFEEWMLIQREALHQQAVYALVHLAAYSDVRGDYAEAIGHARKQLELEPWNEEAHRHLIYLLWVTGQRTQAISQYQMCRRVLFRELGIEPGLQTDALYRRVEAGAEYVPNLQDEARTRTNLPPQMSPFIGREQELSRIADRLESPDRRLITLVGTGGIGKSRLALAAAAQHLGTYEDGVYFVPMAPVTTPDLIASALAKGLSLHFTGKEDESSQLIKYLADREMLLVIDNFEHLLDGVGILRKILEVAPRVSLLVTSRERLNFQSETVIDLAGLACPPDNAPVALTVEQAISYAAVTLFVERAMSRQEDFVLTESMLPSVVQICRIVAGLPLAIELATGHFPYFSCEEIAEAIQANLDFLTTDLRDMPQAHSSIRAVFNYSWGLLTDAEKAAFRRLSVFRGGWSIDAAEKITGASRTLLVSLSSKSLIRRTEQDSEVRHDIHEVLRQYATEQLNSSPEEKFDTFEAHAHYFMALAEAAEPNLRGQNQEQWLSRLEREHANMQAALHWAAESGNRELGLRLGGALCQFWLMHAHYSTGRALLAQFDLQSTERSTAWAKALFGAGRLAMQQGDYITAQQLMEQCQALYQELDDTNMVRKLLIERGNAYRRQGDYNRGEQLSIQALQMARTANDRSVMASALTSLGSTAINRGEFAEARKLYNECLAIQREAADKFGIAWTLTDLGTLSEYEGNLQAARQFYAESLDIRREIGDKWGIATCHSCLGDLAVIEGNYDEARGLIMQGLKGRRELGDKWAISASLMSLGLVEYKTGNLSQAVGRWSEALSLAYAQEGRFLICYCLTGLAAAALKMGNVAQAVSMIGTVTTLLNGLGVRLSPLYGQLYDQVVTAGQIQLAGSAWSSAWTAGTTMTLDSAYSFARAL